jgi:hypothetical protein
MAMPAFKNFEKPKKTRNCHLANVRFFPFRELTPIWSLPPGEVDQNIHRNLQSLLVKHLAAGEIVAASL